MIRVPALADGVLIAAGRERYGARHHRRGARDRCGSACAGDCAGRNPAPELELELEGATPLELELEGATPLELELEGATPLELEELELLELEFNPTPELELVLEPTPELELVLEPTPELEDDVPPLEEPEAASWLLPLSSLELLQPPATNEATTSTPDSVKAPRLVLPHRNYFLLSLCRAPLSREVKLACMLPTLSGARAATNGSAGYGRTRAAGWLRKRRVESGVPFLVRGPCEW